MTIGGPFDAVPLTVMQAGQKGLGVFAGADIVAGKCVEVAPVRPFDWSKDLPQELSDLPLAWTDEQDAIAFGSIQLVNHSEEPNCRVEPDLDNQTIALIALRDIKAGEELTFAYQCPLWFTPEP